MSEYKIFIVDDEESICKGMKIIFERDYEVKTFSTGQSALKGMEKEPPHLVLLDIGLPDLSGIEVFRKMKKLFPEILVIMITAYEDVDSVVSSMKLGAYDYVVKPVDMDRLELLVRNALDSMRMRLEYRNLQEKYITENMPCFIGESDAIQDVMGLIKKVAKSADTPVLIVGETGTGKELLAEAIHYRSPNFRGPFIPVNCAAIPEDLIESELFGYEKGAFSGARATGKKGLIEQSQDGTLFLDEVGDLSLQAQAKLLRFLESGEFYRVGGTKKIKLTTRIVSATNKDINKLIEEEKFRKDLYFRLGVIKLQVPSLNQRPSDIIPLAEHFLVEYSKKFDKKFTRISDETKCALKAYNWSGNVRELKNMMERAVLMGKGPEITVDDLGIKSAPAVSTTEPSHGFMAFPPLPPAGIDLNEAKEEMEKYYIRQAEQMAEGNASKAAKLLNMNHHTFRYRKEKLLEH